MTDEPDDPKKVIPFDRDKALIERIEKLIANPPEGSVVLEYTPGVATHEIEHRRGIHNRPRKTSAIVRYAVDMAKDEWLLNGSTIVYTDWGLLGDGQNRLIACRRADRPFKTHVVFGVPHEYFYSMDQGRVRGPADVLHIAGVPNSNIVYPAVRWAELIAAGIVKSRRTFTPPEILELYRTKHKRVEDFVKEAREVCKINEKQPISLVMALLYSFDNVDTAAAAEFQEHWAGCSYPDSYRAIRIMQQELEVLGKKSFTRIHDVVRAAMIVNAWNVVRDNAKPRAALIRWDFDQPFPAIK